MRAMRQDDESMVLEADGVSYAYGSYHALREVSLVSLCIQAGELVALHGRNGAGKSTLLRCLAGWAPATAGAIRVVRLPLM